MVPRDVNENSGTIASDILPRERSSSVVRDIQLEDEAPLVPLVLERQHSDTPLWFKEVCVGDPRRHRP